MANRDFINIVTPSGKAIFPYLTEPNTKFNPIGEYKVNLSLEKDDATPIISKIEEALEKARALAPQGKKPREAQLPYEEETDENGNLTGRCVFKFKNKAQLTTKDGRTVTMKPKLFDAKGNYLQEVESVWGGSILRVSADLIPYFVSAVGVGVSLRLKAVQIIDLIKADASNATSYGFESTSGYEATDNAPTATEFSDNEEDF